LARAGHKGYIDETGRWVIKGDYSPIEDFSDGLALAAGTVLDLTGNVVAQAPAFRVQAFSEGLASYEAQGKPSLRSLQPGRLQYRDYAGLKGFIDRTGSLVIPPKFSDVGPFVNGLARAALDGYCHLATVDGGREGTPTTGYPSSCGGAPDDAVSPCAVGFINAKGGFAIQPAFESARDFQEGLAAVRIGGLWGYIGVDGKLAIPQRFEQAQSFREGLAAVKTHGKWGFVDRAGALVIPARFESVEPFSDSLAIAYSDAGSYYIDRTGQTKIAGPFREATPFVHGLAAVLLTDEHIVYINKAGQTVFSYYRSVSR
jgi:hypothetical protein